MNKFLLASALVALASPATAETLHEAIASAYASNPTLAAARARQDGLAETPEQARAAGRLTAAADAIGGYDRFDYGKGGNGTVSASLPIWTGGRVSSAVRAANSDVAAGAAGLRDTQASVLETVVSAYAKLLYDQKAVEIAQADIALLDNQLADSRSRFNLGNATRTDVARIEAERASAAANLANVQAQQLTDMATYHATVGHDAEALVSAIPTPATLPATLDKARSLALASNPLFQQSQRIAEADAARIDQARAGRNPSLALNGAYGYDVDLGRSQDRGFPRTSSAGISLHIPILTGGLVSSQVREASAEHRAAVFDSDAAAREAVRSTEASWAALAGARAREAAAAQSVTAADLALKGVRAEYAFGLRSTLDILVADESLRGAQLTLARSQSDTLVAEAALLHATGQLDEATF